MNRILLMSAIAGGLACGKWCAAETPDLTDFRTVDTATTTVVGQSATTRSLARIGYLGVSWEREASGKLVVAEVSPGAPAEKAGVLRGDVVQQLDGNPITSADQFRDRLQALPPGQTIKLQVERGGKTLELSAQVGATSNPLSLARQRAIMGIQLEDTAAAAGALVGQITEGLPAAQAGLKSGDVIRKADGALMASSETFRDLLSAKAPGDVVKLTVQRAEEELELQVQLTAEAGSRGRRGMRDPTENSRSSFYWRRDVYRLAVVAVEFPNAKHNDKIGIDDWERSLFSEGRYLGTNATGQETYGSLNDYYREQSAGKLRVEGRLFDWIEVSDKREAYATADKSKLLNEALDKLEEREGKRVLDDYDGLCFVYAGGRVQTNRGGLFWPHRATLTHRNKRWGYFIVPEGGSRMTNVSVICHEFGHMLGLPDLYARPENPGSEGISVWCAMSQQANNGRPQHFSAWCKEKLGWLEPTVIDPTVPQKLILAPVEGNPRECYKILVRRDGSEYLLLENRRKLGFDAGLPGEGLLIWRVVNNRPLLEESHGIEGPAGPGSFRDVVPYPSKANTAFTPYTTPTSRGQLGGGLPVHLTNIRQLDDGRITFYVGYEFQ
jgi:M6 family metalloprotease-like protein